jgi:hypothetical protein
MKILHITAAAALLTNTMWSAAALGATVGTATVEDPVAQGLSAANLLAAQGQCTALAALHAPLNYTGTLDESSIEATLVSGPTEVDPSARDKSNIVGTGTFIPGHTYIQGDPFRIGGSVNLFGDQYADSGSWTDSEYDFTNQFTSIFSYAFNCNMSESVHVPVQGYYEIDDNDHGSDEDAIRANCVAFTNLGPDASQPWWGTDHAFCKFVTTVPAHDEDQDRPDEAGTPINQSQTDTLTGHENHGGPVQAPGGIFHIGQVVICISPSTSTKKGVPGAWRAQNGYDGGSSTGPAAGCNTPYFKIAPWGAGTDSSNGTYISVPDYVY